jgi:hypothetical protein
MILRAVGVESEMELAFAGLHQLCAPFLDRLDRLPPPQRDALSVVFGLLPDLRVEGLSDADARAVLRTALRSPLDPAVLDGIVAEARGNPLALLELPHGRTQAEITFGFGLPSTLSLVSRMEQGFLRQLQPLPPDTRRLLLAAAVEPVGDAILLWGRPSDSASERTRRRRPRPPD